MSAASSSASTTTSVVSSGWRIEASIWMPPPCDLSHTLPLIDAVWNGDVDGVRRLHAQLGAKFRADPLGSTSTLGIAVRSNNVEMIRLLIALGANPNRIVDQCSPLLLATRLNRPALVFELLQGGADPLAGIESNSMPQSPMQLAIRHRRFRIIRALLAAAATDRRIPIDMHLAAETADAALIRLLIENGGRIDLCNADGMLPLHSLLKTLHTRPISAEALDLLMTPNHAQEFVPRDGTRSNAMLLASANRAAEHLVARLIAAGASPAVADWRSMTPLMHAAVNNNYHAMRAILHSRAPLDIDARDSTSRTALFIAAGRDAPQLVRLLLAFGADANVVGPSGITPMETTCCVDVVGAILAAGWPLTSARFFGQNLGEASRRAFKQIGVEKFVPLRARLAEICFALQALALPALVTLAIVDEAIDYANDVPMYLKWNAITKVKHAVRS
jgi:ankyrin repeat protein